MTIVSDVSQHADIGDCIGIMGHRQYSKTSEPMSA